MRPICVYHDPKEADGRRGYDPAVLAEVLAVLQERTSARGEAGSDLPWAWAILHDMPRSRLATRGGTQVRVFPCPGCGEEVRVDRGEGVRLPGAAHAFWAFYGLCPGCGTVYWW